MHQPDGQEGEEAGERDIGEEMPAAGHAQEPDAGPEGERARIGERPPGRRHQRGRRQRPERARGLARHERAIVRAIAARIPPRHEMLGAAELGHVDGARAAPVTLEDDVGEEAGRERERGHHQGRGPARDQHRPPRQHQLAQHGESRGRDQEGHDQAAEITHAVERRIEARPKAACGRIEERPHQVEIEPRVEAEQQADRGGERQRDQKPSAIHLAVPAGGARRITAGAADRCGRRPGSRQDRGSTTRSPRNGRRPPASCPWRGRKAGAAPGCASSPEVAAASRLPPSDPHSIPAPASARRRPQSSVIAMARSASRSRAESFSLALFNCPQAARMSRPRGVRTGDA